MNCPGCGVQVKKNDITNCDQCGAGLDTQEQREITAKIEPRKLEEGWRRKAIESLKANAVVKVGVRTDLGRVRENNEDKFEFFEPDDELALATRGAFYAVADGMGGHAAGQIASELALKTVISSFYSDLTGDLEEALVRAVQQANSLIYDTAKAIVERSGMGTTLTAAIIRGDDLFVAQVGDSRAYLIRGGKIEQITEDHSWVAEQVRLGVLTEHEAHSSPFRNVITRSMGTQPGVEPDVWKQRLKEGDVLVLCSDGLTGNVSADDILGIAGKKDPSPAARELVDLANDRGGNDNITVLVLAVRDIEQVEPQQPKEPKGRGGRLKRLFGGE